MPLNVIATQSASPAAAPLQPAASGTLPADPATGRLDADEAPAGPPARRIGDELLDELTSWPPRDRAGMFRNWHRGALSLVQLNVVAVIEAEGPLPMSRLADELDVSVASATGIIDRMERRGLVERRHATDDRRVVAVHLTEQGADVFRVFTSRRREHLARLLAELSDDELAGLLTGIRALRAARQRLAPIRDPEPAPGCGAPPGDPAARTPEHEDVHP